MRSGVECIVLNGRNYLPWSHSEGGQGQEDANGKDREVRGVPTLGMPVLYPDYYQFQIDRPQPPSNAEDGWTLII